MNIYTTIQEKLSIWFSLKNFMFRFFTYILMCEWELACKYTFSSIMKVLDSFTKLYPRVLSLVATPYLRVIFIILIITLNLHDPSLSEPGYNIGPKNIGCESGYKVVL